MRASIYVMICAVLLSLAADSPTGEIRGKIYENNSRDGVPFASVSVFLDSMQVLTTVTDFDGNFSLKPLSDGLYRLKVACVGYKSAEVRKVQVVSNKFTIADVKMEKGAGLKQVMVTEYKSPRTVKREAIQAAPARDINSIAQEANGVYQREQGDELNIRGSRSKSKIKCPQNLETEVNSEEYDNVVENKFFDVTRNPLSTFSIDVDAASYSNIRRFITKGSLPPQDAVRVEEMINYFSYSYKQPEDGTPFSINTEISTCPWNSKHRLVQIGLNGKSIATAQLPQNNLVFLIDVSGSMDEPDKLPLLKRSFHLLVDQMRREDRVAIVVYAGNAGLVLPSTRGNDKEKILAAIDGLEAGGSTAGGAGIQLAYRIAKENFNSEGNNRVILATDGDFNVGVSSDEALIKLIEEKREEGVFLTVLGFGTGNYKDAKMEKLADKGNGNFAYVDNIMEANKVFVKEMGATLNTIAKDVKLQIEFNPAKVKAYRLVGYENRVLRDEDFNDDKKDAGELGSGKTVTALYEIIPAGSEEQVSIIDPLKYQNTTPGASSEGNELLTVKFRYKDPNGAKSKLIVHPLIDNQIEIAKTSIDFRFAASVAEFGMILRDSKFKGDANFKNVLALARGSKGTDEEGYRAEFVRLVETAELLAKETVVNEK